MTLADLSPLANHLWQSTLCAAVAWLLTLTLRKNRAAVRYWLWLAASAKFLIPFALLAGAGSQLGWRAAPAMAQPQLSFVMEEIGRPFAAPPVVVRSAGERSASDVFPAILLCVWLSGFAIASISWFRRWRHIRAIRRTATPLSLNLPIEVLSSSARLEPGVFGIRKPVLLLPEGITERLTPLQLEAVLAHELCHVRRRDNLTATIHMVVEAIFWFHPLVWWIRERMVEERERACDEEVLKVVSEPEIYAEGILNVCRFYLASPLTSVSGVTGANLKLRIAAIIANRTANTLSSGRKLLLATAAIMAVAGPVAVGTLYASPSRAQSLDQTAPTAFEVASVKPNRSGGRTTRRIEPGKIAYIDITLGEFIRMAYSLSYHQISGPDWIVNAASSDRYDVIASAAGPASKQEMTLMLRTLLVDKFHLALHHEARKVPMYALIVAKNGPKFKAGDGGALSTGPSADGGYSFKNWTMSEFANSLSMMEVVGRPVLDRTGLEGSYSFNAKLSDIPKEASGQGATDGRMSDGVLFWALQDLGLKLEPRRDPVEFLVIDHADKAPVEN